MELLIFIKGESVNTELIIFKDVIDAIECKSYEENPEKRQFTF